MAKKVKKASSKAKSSKKTAVVGTQPGVIKSIMECLTNAKAKKQRVTAAQIVEQLAKQFPDREASGMLITVRAQLSRLPSEKKFEISKMRDGRVVTYQAA